VVLYIGPMFYIYFYFPGAGAGGAGAGAGGGAPAAGGAEPGMLISPRLKEGAGAGSEGASLL